MPENRVIRFKGSLQVSSSRYSCLFVIACCWRCKTTFRLTAEDNHTAFFLTRRLPRRLLPPLSRQFGPDLSSPPA